MHRRDLILRTLEFAHGCLIYLLNHQTFLLHAIAYDPDCPTHLELFLPINHAISQYFKFHFEFMKLSYRLMY